MVTSTQTEAESFHYFLAKEIANGGRHKSPEDLLQDWRRVQQELRESAESIREAIDDMHAGDRGQPVAEVFDEIRRAHGWTTT